MEKPLLLRVGEEALVLKTLITGEPH